MILLLKVGMGRRRGTVRNVIRFFIDGNNNLGICFSIFHELMVIVEIVRVGLRLVEVLES
jgi:hypothetical protein